MNATDNHLQLPEQMSWVDYCDLIGNEHCWPKVQVGPAFRIPDRKSDAGSTAPAGWEKTTKAA